MKRIENVNRIIFGWWNTSLSPVGRARANNEQYEFASNIIGYLLNDVGITCLGLGEVTLEDMYRIKKESKISEYEIVDCTYTDGRLHSDIGLLFRKDRLEVCSKKKLIDSRGNKRLKTAFRIDFKCKSTQEPLHVFVSHWPSRLWCIENGADRAALGTRLRDRVDELYKDYKRAKKLPNIVLFGDYNDEPYNSSLSEHLLSTRDRAFVKKNTDYLYNPFWRKLGEMKPHKPSEPVDSVCGTCYHASGNETKWRTFDQIIFSSAFLGNGIWELNEEFTAILPLIQIEKSSSRTDMIFDHLPIMSAIDYQEGI